MPDTILIRAAIHRLVLATVALYLAVAVVIVGVVFWQLEDSRNATQDRDHAKQNICYVEVLLRNQARESIKDSRDWLAQHPKGIPGIPADLVRKSIEKKQNQIKAMTDPSCNGS